MNVMTAILICQVFDIFYFLLSRLLFTKNERTMTISPINDPLIKFTATCGEEFIFRIFPHIWNLEMRWRWAISVGMCLFHVHVALYHKHDKNLYKMFLCTALGSAFFGVKMMLAQTLFCITPAMWYSLCVVTHYADIREIDHCFIFTCFMTINYLIYS